jgi:hypothetical protein
VTGAEEARPEMSWAEVAASTPERTAVSRPVSGWWAAGALGRVWNTVADRLERNGLRPAGSVVVEAWDRQERHALGDLLGWPVTSKRVSIDLAALDERLRSRAGLSLLEAVVAVRHEPLVDRPARRAEHAARREAPFVAAREWMAARPGLDWPWLEAWFDGLRRDGVLTRDMDPVALIVQALDVLADRRESLEVGRGSWADVVEGVVGVGADAAIARTELAARVCGDAHALDSDRRLTAVVLRALAARAGRQVAAGADGRRSLWESIGVVSDSVSSTCLTWGLAFDVKTSVGARLQGHVEAGAPVHLTWWDLRHALRLGCNSDVLVCENPRVLEAVAESSLAGIGVVCTSGRPNLVVAEVLTMAGDTGARLRYHGDFDWPGIAMANDARSRFGAVPWLMGAADYLSAPASLPLTGTGVEPAWDAELGAAMRRRGLVVHEEAVLTAVVDALRE